jgi:pilus assembly protein CpaF
MWTIHLQGSSGKHPDPSFPTGKVRIGKDADCDLRLPGWRVSGRHAELFVSNDQGFLRDLGSSTGTLVNGKPVTTHGPLTCDDKIQVGPHSFTATWAAEQGKSRTAAAAVNGAAPRAPLNETAAAAPLPIDAPRAPATPDLAARPNPPDESFVWRKVLHDRLLEAFDVRRVDVHRMTDVELRSRTDQLIGELIERTPEIPPQLDRTALIAAVRDEAIGLGLLEPLLADTSVTEIMVNRADEVFIERGGVLERFPVAFTSDRAVTGIIERIVAPIGRRIDESSPMVDARLKDGSRVNAVIPPLALKGPSITIRKFSKRKLAADDLLRFGSANREMIEFMRVTVEHRKNLVISGGTGSGKTTLLNILSNFIPKAERIVTIEDAAELQLHHPNLVSLESRPANIEGKGQIAIRDLVRNSLRMRPDRIVVGECRGGEALDMLQAMNTGHDGSLTTAHANNPRDMLARLETMVLMAGLELPSTAIREQIASAIDIVVQQTRFACGSRKITHICEVTGVESGRIQLQNIFEFVQTGVDKDHRTQGYFTGCGFVPEYYESLRRIGVPLDLGIFERRDPAVGSA